MKDFNFYLTERSVRKTSPDINLAISLAKESIDRLDASKKMMKFIEPKYSLENSYESIYKTIARRDLRNGRI